MNAHLTHNHEHWMDDFMHTLWFGLHSHRVWQIVGIVALISVLMLLFVFAASFSGSQSVSYYYGYPAYPMVP
ncbi:MAG: hypothetical protein ACIAQZ_02155 [Sedimentisphaeraceae bacterium JB056]